MNNFPRISIITPNYNGAKFLEETILSVIGQDYPNLEYIIIDGCSTDESIDIIQKYKSKLAWWVSEPDNGMYDAIQKGFDRSTGELLGWINSDDILHKKSLFAIADIFSNNQQIRWVQGYPNVIDESGRIVYHRPQRFSKYAFYLKDYHDGIFIQQESTFWTRDLWIESGAYLSKKFKYAGDFELWIRFFRFTELYNTMTLLGSFRNHGHGQISKKQYNEYILECNQIITDAVKCLTVSEKRRLNKIKISRRIMKVAPRISRLLNLKRMENYWLSNPLSIDFDFTLKHYAG